jgi:hypothetical protein
MIRDVYSGSQIPDPRSGFYSIPDPEVKSTGKAWNTFIIAPFWTAWDYSVHFNTVALNKIKGEE